MILMAAFDQLLIYMGFTLSLSAMLTVIGLMRIRSRGAEAKDTYRCPGYPFTPILFVAGNIWIILYTITSRPVAVLFGILTILAGIALYGISRLRRERDIHPPIPGTGKKQVAPGS
jgi:APA family basic amino acid/polyamine antiporter